MKDATEACLWSRLDIVSGLLRKDLLLPSPFPYYTADGKTVTAVTARLRDNTHRVRIQVVTVRSRTASIRPPIAMSNTISKVPNGSIIKARTEKVE